MSSIPATHKVVVAESPSHGLDTIKYVDQPTPEVGPHDILVKNKYAGVNFVEKYFRAGIYPGEFPLVFGREASGTVAAVGDEVTKYKVGDKVAYAAGKSFAQYTKLADSTIQIGKLPADTTDEKLKVYGATLIQGLTALSFTTEAHEVKKGEFILVWAAAGGVGKIILQIAKERGAHAIAIASTDEKLAQAKALGAEYLIKSDEDIVAKVKEYTNGKGVAASFDSVGKDSFDPSLGALAPKGSFVSFGNASGVIPPIPITKLINAIKFSRPSVFTFIATPEDWERYTSILFKAIDSGSWDFDISKTYPLSEYAQAAEDLEGRKTTGKLVLEIPQ